MSVVFFAEWPMWQKLVFCLACAIIVTVLLGCSKLAYTRWKLRKFVQITEEEPRGQTLQREMIQQHKLATAEDKKEVAFGVRAIESGIEVEGVWISRSNTPEVASRNTSVTSSMRDPTPRTDFDVDLEKQELRMARIRSVSNATIGTARTANRAVSLDRGSSVRPSRTPSPEGEIARPTRARHPPSSYVRFSCNPYLIRQSTFEGLEAIHKASTSISSQDFDYSTSNSSNSTSSSHSGNDVDAITASGPSLFTAKTPQPRPRQRQKSSTDLELLNKHRTSQAAEMGQLTPRVKLRNQNLSLDIQNLPAFSRASTTAAQMDYFSSPSRVRPSSSAGISPTNPFSPAVNALPPSVRRSSMPDVTPFTQFCKTAAPSPATRPQRAEPDSRKDSDASSIYETPSTSPIIPASDGAAALRLPSTLALPPAKRTSFELKTEPKILRGHGSGFEILRPGSLNPKLPKPSDENDDGDATLKPRQGPPISLHNNARSHSRSDSAENRRSRLQKKRRPSPDSSSFDSSSSNASRRSRMSLFLGQASQRRSVEYVEHL